MKISLSNIFFKLQVHTRNTTMYTHTHNTYKNYSKNVNLYIQFILFYLFQNESHGLFLGFRVVTLIPFEPKLIDVPRLSPHQVNTKVMS